MPVSHAITYAAVLTTLYAAHSLGDHWIQTHHQATAKGGPGWPGRLADLAHILTLTATKAVFLMVTIAALRLHVNLLTLCAGLAIDAASHYWADRRTTLAALARLTGKSSFYTLGAPRPGHDDNPSLGTGAYALDQSWHLTWLWIAALIIAAG